VCGSNFTVAGKDYYRCAGQRGRGTCHNTLSIRRSALEEAVLSVIQNQLLTEDLTKLFVTEFESELQRLSEGANRKAAQAAERLNDVDRQLHALAQNMLVSEASPTLHRMLSELEQEKANLEAMRPIEPMTAQILPHPTLLRRFHEKLHDLSAALNDKTVRPQAAELIGELIIESVTIYPGERPEAEVSANIADLIRFAANENGP
jgi:site-specific DNA recombinase